MDSFESLTYEHVNFIFSCPSQIQDGFYPLMHSSAYYKYGYSESWNPLHCDQHLTYTVGDDAHTFDEQTIPLENFSSTTEVPNVSVNSLWGRNSNTATQNDPVECPQSHHNSHDYQAFLHDNVDPDNMTYEELLELGEAVGTQSRGLSPELIALLPISKHKCGFFVRKKSRSESCVICQMKYKRGDRKISLPCKHVYHASCGIKWLSINKACPICYTEVLGDTSKTKK